MVCKRSRSDRDPRKCAYWSNAFFSRFPQSGALLQVLKPKILLSSRVICLFVAETFFRRPPSKFFFYVKMRTFRSPTAFVTRSGVRWDCGKSATVRVRSRSNGREQDSLLPSARLPHLIASLRGYFYEPFYHTISVEIDQHLLSLLMQCLDAFLHLFMAEKVQWSSFARISKHFDITKNSISEVCM